MNANKGVEIEVLFQQLEMMLIDAISHFYHIGNQVPAQHNVILFIIDIADTNILLLQENVLQNKIDSMALINEESTQVLLKVCQEIKNVTLTEDALIHLFIAFVNSFIKRIYLITPIYVNVIIASIPNMLNRQYYSLLFANKVKKVSKKHESGQYMLSHKKANVSEKIAKYLGDYPIYDALILSIITADETCHKNIQFNTEQALVIVDLTRCKKHSKIHNEIQQINDYQPFKKLTNKIGVYPVIDNIKQMHDLLNAGAKTCQLRIKIDKSIIGYSDQNHKFLADKIKKSVLLGQEYQAQVFINDHWQLAIKHHAFGVHLGQEDIVASNLTAIKNANLALGISCHSFFELCLAMQLKPSYIALGHIFSTNTKKMPSKPQGCLNLANYVKLIDATFPTVAIGGINLTKLAEINTTGVDDIAVVSALTQANNIQQAFCQLQHKWNELNNVKG